MTLTRPTGIRPSAVGTPRSPKAALVLLCAANFAVLLDSQSVILALPSIAADLGMAAADAQWVLSAKLLAFGGLLLLGGRAADLLGRRRVFMVGTALFLLGSLACGLAWNGAVIVGARALLGVAAAMMVPTALSILVNAFPEGAERNRALAGWAGIAGIGASAGLLVGGLLTQTLGWQWVFLVNVPVAVVMLALTPALLRESRDTGRKGPYDVAGAVTSTVALLAIVAAVGQAPTTGWVSVPTLGMLAAAVVLLALFVVVERRSAAPLVPLSMLRDRVLAGGNLVTLTMGMAAFGLSVTISVYGQVVLGYAPLEFGSLQSVMPLLAFVGAYVGQSVVTRAGFRPVVAACLVLMAGGSLLLAQVPVDGSYGADILWGLVVFGPGLGAGTAAASVAALARVPERHSGVASGLNTAALQIGGALGVAVVSSVAASFTTAPGSPVELTSGLRAAFVACVVFVVAGLLIASVLLRRRRDGGARRRGRGTELVPPAEPAR